MKLKCRPEVFNTILNVTSQTAWILQIWLVRFTVLHLCSRIECSGTGISETNMPSKGRESCDWYCAEKIL